LIAILYQSNLVTEYLQITHDLLSGSSGITKALLNDLNLKYRRDVLKDFFETALPATMQDVVVIFVMVCGWKDGRYIQETYANKVYAGVVAGRKELHPHYGGGRSYHRSRPSRRQLPEKGFVRQEEITLDDVLQNRFGRAYDPIVSRLKDAVWRVLTG